jgi:hypothetical protein
MMPRLPVIGTPFEASRSEGVALLAKTHSENANYRDNESNTRRAKDALQHFRTQVLGHADAWPSHRPVAPVTSRNKRGHAHVARRIRSIEYEFETRRHEQFFATGLVLDGREAVDAFFRGAAGENQRYGECLENAPDPLVRREFRQYAIAGLFFYGLPFLYADLAKNAFFDPVSPDTLKLLNAALVGAPLLTAAALLLTPLGTYVAETLRKSGSERFGRILNLRNRLPRKARWAYTGRDFRLARPLLNDIFHDASFTQKSVNAQFLHETSFLRRTQDVPTKVDLLYQRDADHERLVVFFRVESQAAFPVPRAPGGFLSIFPEPNLVPTPRTR